MVEIRERFWIGSSMYADGAADFIEDLTRAINAIPKEYRGSATLDLDSYDEYGSCVISFEGYYKRPETVEETAERLRAGQSRMDQQEAFERQQLADLKRKYEAS